MFAHTYMLTLTEVTEKGQPSRIKRYNTHNASEKWRITGYVPVVYEEAARNANKSTIYSIKTQPINSNNGAERACSARFDCLQRFLADSFTTKRDVQERGTTKEGETGWLVENLQKHTQGTVQLRWQAASRFFLRNFEG